MDLEKSNRDFITEAYEAAQKEFLEAEKLMETPEDLVRKEQENLELQEAEELLELNILDETVTTRYRMLESEIIGKKELLNKLYGVKVQSESIRIFQKAREELSVSLQEIRDSIEAKHRETMEQREADEAKKEEELLRETENRLGELETEYKELKAASEQEFHREQAEYDYRLKRERKSSKENREAETVKREEALRQQEKEAEDRKKGVETRLAEIAELQKTVEEMPSQIEAARQSGMKKAEALLNKNFEYEQALEEKDQGHRIEALKLQYERLQEKFKNLQEEKAEISRRLEKCNAESRSLTSDTVRSIGGINILNAEARVHNGTN